MRSKPNARPYAVGGTAAARSALRPGVRAPRPSHAAASAKRTWVARDASASAPVPIVVSVAGENRCQQTGEPDSERCAIQPVSWGREISLFHVGGP